MAELHWFPLIVADWLSSPAILDMLPEQEGAYIRLLVTAWGKGDAEPSLPVDDRSLAQRSRLGGRWKELGPLIREQFTERDGRLFNAKLSEVWFSQQKKHATAVAKGTKGGHAKAAGSTGSSTMKRLAKTPVKPLAEHVAEPVAVQNVEETLVEPTALTSSLSPKALGVETPRPAELPGDRGRVTTGTVDKLSAIIARVAAGFKPVEAT